MRTATYLELNGRGTLRNIQKLFIIDPKEIEINGDKKVLKDHEIFKISTVGDNYFLDIKNGRLSYCKDGINKSILRDTKLQEGLCGTSIEGVLKKFFETLKKYDYCEVTTSEPYKNGVRYATFKLKAERSKLHCVSQEVELGDHMPYM